MTEPTDYADLVALQAALEAMADDPAGWGTHAVRGVAERAADAIQRLQDAESEQRSKYFRVAAKLATDLERVRQEVFAINLLSDPHEIGERMLSLGARLSSPGDAEDSANG